MKVSLILRCNKPVETQTKAREKKKERASKASLPHPFLTGRDPTRLGWARRALRQMEEGGVRCIDG